MDANREDAYVCFKVAKTAMLRQDYTKALKFLKKANSMYPTPEFKHLLDECLNKLSHSEQSREYRDHSHDSSNRSTSGNVNTADRSPQNNPDTTPSEHDKLCRRVLSAKTYYEVLLVAREDSVDTIKRSYKKLALKLHPDKNPSHLASEAFKKVSTAFQCLTNPKSREHYDMYGEDGPETQTAHREQFVTPEQLFEAFFGLNVNHNRMHRNFVYTRRANDNRLVGQTSPLSQLIPLFLLFLFIILPSLLTSRTAEFQFEKSSKFSQKETTVINGVVYYVDPTKFPQKYPPKSQQRLRMEYEVDYAFFDYKCSADRKESQRKIYSYLSSFKNPPSELYDTPKSCVTLGRLRRDYSDFMNGGF
ncbi:DnaJ domain containing protein [Theileria equi strain WA]|uniref:DnaJ domain containing protein n=1 Tax=Theileria equi strain WA TaxID=1537102 RepID=L1LGN1_THEEQ|nr:DnaJ domain containing protein [Theileria equi strain WA]EKX74273.1 DnaJ domain containing protein [Theileria equi strain WA]|eukprot:XP_004833725.1 DnaJ domain containing protein [Theileria equi strain WA]